MYQPPAAGSQQQQQQLQQNIGAMYQPPANASYSNMECYSTTGQKHAYPPSDAMNEALAAFYRDEQSAAKRSRLN